MKEIHLTLKEIDFARALLKFCEHSLNIITNILESNSCLLVNVYVF